MFGIQENMAGVGCGCGVDDLEFETVVLFGIFSMRVSAVDDNSDCIKLASLGCGLALDIGQFGKCVLLVHNLFKYNFLFWARFEIQDNYKIANQYQTVFSHPARKSQLLLIGSEEACLVVPYFIYNNLNIFKMTKVISENDPMIIELRELEVEMRQAAEQAKIYENSLMIISKTIRKNQLTIKQLQTIPADRLVYVPLGRAFLKRNKQETIKEISEASKKLEQNSKDLEKSLKYYGEKTNEKYQIYKQASEKLRKKFQEQGTA